MNPADVIVKMGSTGIIATCHPGNEITTVGIVKASYKGGLRLLEMKHHREDRSFFLFKRTSEETKSLAGLILGAGGVPDATTAEKYLQNDAQFILSPFLKEDMAKVCQDHGKLWVPGCTSLRDVELAVAMGAEVVKILPADLLGVGFFKEVGRHFPATKLISSGIITGKDQELIKWYESGILCMQITHGLFTKEIVGLKDWSGIEFKVFSFMQRVKRIKSSINTFVDKGDDLAQKG